MDRTLIAIDYTIAAVTKLQHLYSEEMVKKLPLLAVLSGATSSMRGAAFLSGTDDAVVVDIGDNTTNVGMIKSGLPCMSNDCFKVKYS